MPTSKQRVRDRDYFGEYQKKSCYTTDQWMKIITNEAFVSPTELAILKEIFLSANHAASLSQLAFRHKKDASYFTGKMNQLASNIGRPNGYRVDVDLDGNEYWWYLLFWGKNTKLAGLEWKLLPELAEALEYIYPELEDQYNTYMSEIERSEQIRYTKEDAVWIASSLLLFEKVYLEHPTDIYDLLLMQYEVSQRSQKIYGQDVDVDIITDNCNADSPKCVFPYLRDIDKYWRVCYPGEIEDASVRPEKIDYNAYVPSKFGFVKIKELCEFLETDYCKLTDPNYIEIDESNPFYKMANFLKTNGRRRYMDLTAPTEEDIERFLLQKEQGKEALSCFHQLGAMLTSQYPSFVQTEQASWLEKDNTTIRNCWIDSYAVKEYKEDGPTLSILCGQKDDQKGNVIFSVLLNFPIESHDLTEQIMEKCSNLTVLTSANFQVEKSIRMDGIYSSAFGNSLLAYESFDEHRVLEEPVQDMMLRIESSIQILASYYLDICESVYAPLKKTESDLTDPQRADETTVGSAQECSFEVSQADPVSVPTAITAAPVYQIKRQTPTASHEDRHSLSSTYPLNILFQGPSHSGKGKLAVYTCVGIIEDIDFSTVTKESYDTVLERFHHYREEGRIFYSGSASLTYEDWMENEYGEGKLTVFANKITHGRYVILTEDLDAKVLQNAMKDACYLIDAKKREGQQEYTSVTLSYLQTPFSLPSNLHFVGTTNVPLSQMDSHRLYSLFRIQPTDPTAQMTEDTVIEGLSVKHLLSLMNQRIQFLIGSGYEIGFRFFDSLTPDSKVEDLGNIMYHYILPYLLRSFQAAGYKDPYQAASLVFGDYKKTKPEYRMITDICISSKELFGASADLPDKILYQIQKSAFFALNSYQEL